MQQPTTNLALKPSCIHRSPDNLAIFYLEYNKAEIEVSSRLGSYMGTMGKKPLVASFKLVAKFISCSVVTRSSSVS